MAVAVAQHVNGAGVGDPVEPRADGPTPVFVTAKPFEHPQENLRLNVAGLFDIANPVVSVAENARGVVLVDGRDGVRIGGLSAANKVVVGDSRVHRRLLTERPRFCTSEYRQRSVICGSRRSNASVREKQRSPLCYNAEEAVPPADLN